VGLINENLSGFVEAVDVGGVSVAVLGQFLHQGVVVISLSKTENGKVNTRMPFAFHKTPQFIRVADTHVEVAVGGQNHAVDTFGIEIGFSQCIGPANPLPPGGGTSGAQAVQGV